MRVPSAVLAVWATLFVVPVVVYGLFSAATGLQPPGGSPLVFLIGVAVSKFGTALAFVAIFHLAEGALQRRWLLYAGLWWVMFAVGEVGQAIGPDYSGTEAALGAISEAIYFPVSGLIVHWMIRGRGRA